MWPYSCFRQLGRHSMTCGVQVICVSTENYQDSRDMMRVMQVSMRSTVHVYTIAWNHILQGEIIIAGCGDSVCCESIPSEHIMLLRWAVAIYDTYRSLPPSLRCAVAIYGTYLSGPPSLQCCGHLRHKFLCATTMITSVSDTGTWHVSQCIRTSVKALEGSSGHAIVRVLIQLGYCSGRVCRRRCRVL